MVAAPLGLAAVERGAVADRDERVLKAAAARMVRVDVAGRDGRDAERGGEIGERRAAASVAALERALELDVERAGKRGREAGGAVRVERAQALARAAGEADEALGVGGDDVERRLRWEQFPLAALDPRARVRVGEDPAQVRVATPALAEERDVRASPLRRRHSLFPAPASERRWHLRSWAAPSGLRRPRA